MRAVVGAATDIGQVREGNEDAFLVRDPLFVVADGMGGHRGGEVASNLALQTIDRLFSAREGSLAEQVERANREVFERSQRDRAVSGMGTTLTAALLEGSRVRLAHVGDSRAYLFRDGGLHLLTQDHTLVHRMVEEGEITEEEAETHPHRSVLTRALGTDGVVDVDEGIVDLRDGDRLLLCTDGLTGMLSDGEIRSVLERTRDPQEAVERLVGAANRAGGVDNITAVLVDVAEDGSAAVSGSASIPDAAATPDVPRRHDTTPDAPGPERPTGAVRAGAPLRVSDRARRNGIRAAIGLAVLVLGVVALRVYLDSQWFVGVSDGRVAVFRGVPARVAGFDLNSVVEETSISADDAESLALYRDQLPDGITADDREAAEAIVEQIRRDVASEPVTGP